MVKLLLSGYNMALTAIFQNIHTYHIGTKPDSILSRQITLPKKHNPFFDVYTLAVYAWVFHDH